VFKYPEIKRLWELTGEIGALGEYNPDDEGLVRVYQILSDALDECEKNNLIEYDSGNVDVESKVIKMR